MCGAIGYASVVPKRQFVSSGFGLPRSMHIKHSAYNGIKSEFRGTHADGRGCRNPAALAARRASEQVNHPL